MYAQSYNRVACYQNQFEEKNPPFSWILGWQLLIMHKERNLGRRRWTNCTSSYVYLREEWLGKNVTTGKKIQPLIINRLIRLVCHYYRIYVLTVVFSFLHCVLDEISFCEVLLQCCSRSNCLEFFWTQMIISLLFVIRGYNYWLKVILRMEKSHLLLIFWKKWQVRILPWTFSDNFSVLIWLWFLFVIVF